MNKIQVLREIEPQDKTVIEALEITKRFKVLPYHEVVRLLESKASDYSLSKLKAKK